MTKHPFVPVLVVLAMVFSVARAADPPSTINYQGVLRDASDKPRNGTFDMVFRFFDLAAAGNEILVDAHTAGGGNAVGVQNGLFNVPLGGGTVSDGAGAGTYVSLSEVFRDYTDVWLEIAIGAETLSPRVKVRASAYALNAGSLQGQPASSFLDTSATPQVKTGQLQVSSSDPYPIVAQDVTTSTSASLGGFYAVAGQSPDHGGAFVNDLGSVAFVANLGEGVRAEGATTGGVFTSLSGMGTATLATGGTGISAVGTSPGSAGHFTDPFHTGEAFLAQGDTGIIATGSESGAEFDSPAGQHAYLASDGLGAAGYFFGRHSEVQIGNGPNGIIATGDSTAGLFSAPSGLVAYLATDSGSEAGYFADPTTGVFTMIGSGSIGMLTTGTKNFMQNHPTDPRRVVVYAALEGAESGTYTRGTGRIKGAEARIALDPTFSLTTDPDIGLTAVVTARKPHADLYVASVSTKEIVVRSGSASQEPIEFDYLVNGLRLGFENQPAILSNEAFPTATVPTLESSEERLPSQPEDVRGSTPLARFATAEASPRIASAGAPAPESRAVDRLGGARALIAGINSPEHALYARPIRPDLSSGSTRADARKPPLPAGAPAGAAASGGPESAPAFAGAATAALRGTPTAPGGPAETPYAFRVSVREPVEAGDVLANDPAGAGLLRLADLDGDPAVVGVVGGPAGTSFTGQAPMALAGTMVTCKVDATARPIEANDLLVASRTPGFAMSGGPEPRAGTIVGKALEPLASGTGTIRILVMSR